ncbi:MAG: BatD family protein [Gammaproteobacteria bacterium]
MVNTLTGRSPALSGNAVPKAPASRFASRGRPIMHSRAAWGNDENTKLLRYSLRVGLCFWLLFFSLAAFAADIGVNVDRNPVNLNDSFQLLFSSGENPDGEPDFSPLDKDFTILNQAKSEQSSWINGSSSRNVQWTLSVMAKRAGTLTVPPIGFGNDRSRPLSITVNQGDNTPHAQSGNEDLFLQVEATPHDPYVQAQIVYTLRLYRKVDIAQASLTEPEVKDAVIEKLGDDSNYRTDVNGQPYVVTERRYAIFPQHSGPLTIRPVVLTAQVVVKGNSRFDSFFSMQSTRTKRVTSKAVSVDVQAIPAAFKGTHWLPAEQLELHEQWSGAIDRLKSGEPLTRTLTLSAKGSTAGQLPDLSGFAQNAATPGGGELKNYPDQPVIQEQKNPDGIVAVRQQKIALIPSQAGEYRLPAIEIPWWNTRTRTLEVAQIPAQTLRAAAGAQTSHTAPQAAAGTETPPAAAPLSLKPHTAEANPLWMATTFISTLGWLLTAVYFWRKNAAKPVQPPTPNTEKRLDHVVKALQKACQRNDAAAAKDALLAWGKEHYRATSLGGIALRSDAALQAEIQTLQGSLYAKDAQPWQGAGLWQALQRSEKQKTPQHLATSVLEPLYKA